MDKRPCFTDNLWVRLRRKHGNTEQGKGTKAMRERTAVLVTPQGGITQQQIQPELETYQSLVDGYIELLPLPGVTMYVNEEAVLLGHPVNAEATALLREMYGVSATIRGNLLIMGPADEAGNETDVPQAVLDHFKEN